MSTIVLKPFRTTTQRFAAGAPVTEADNLAPFTFDHLKKKGFIGAPPKPAKSAAVADPEPPAA